jgi:hemolysin D
MASARKVVAFRPKAADRAREELAFLPAALEVVETPPSPVGRSIAAAIALFFCLALAWACWGEVDIIASAQGRIIPSGNIKLIQPFETGVIRSIDVKDGQRVKAGDILIELDPTMNAAELGHLQGDLVATQLELERLRAALVDNVDPLTEFRAPKGASAAQVETQRQFLVSQNGEFRAKLAVLKRQQEQKEAERATIGATVAKLEATLPIVQERFDVRKTLYGKELGAKLQYLEAQQQLVEMQQELAVQKSRYSEVTAALTVLTETNAQTIAEYRRTRFGEFAEADRKVAGLIQDLVKAEQRTKLQLLTAPVDGIVQQLAVHTIGGVVTPAQTLLVLVPVDGKLEIEAMVPNRDIGFVRAGQDAEVKIDTFNFTRYGILHGKVLSVSQDAISRDKPQDKPNDKSKGTESGTSEPQGQELGFQARISLDRTQMQVGAEPVNLTPGMAVTVEIKTGSRTLMSYLLSPLLRYRQESLRER